MYKKFNECTMPVIKMESETKTLKEEKEIPEETVKDLIRSAIKFIEKKLEL
jgi:hypothetical protein